LYSLDREIALGKTLAADVERQAKLVDDQVVAEFVNRVAQNIVRNSDAKVPFTVKVLDDDTVNAFALPGGHLFVNTGLIDAASSEAELAAALAHEIAHVAARHGTRQASRGEIANVATIPLILMGGWTGFGARQAASILVPMGMLQFSRGMEQEADDLGLQYMYRTGYDPGAFVDFFERLQAMQKRKSSKIAGVFSSHPMNDVRIRNAQKNIQQNLRPRPEYILTTSEFNDVKTRLYIMENRHKQDQQDLNGPTLKKKPGKGTSPDDGDPKDNEDRPTLKRRDLSA
jgi:predicted Zn-dependent protease